MQRVHLEHMGDTIELPPGETVLGRDVGCALRFNDPAVSRRHLRFIRRAHEVFVEDLGSSNGTLVNGTPIKAPVRIVDGDTISLGSRSIIMRSFDSDDEYEASTLLLKDLVFGDSVKLQPMPRATTMQMAAVTLPPPFGNQRCPRCSAQVSELDEACASCNYEWGGFRPTTPTLNRPKPVELRRHERHTIELSLVYNSSELEIEAVSLDLSESGVFVCTQVLDPVGTDCMLTILFDGSPPIRARGVVRRLGEREVQWIRAQMRRAESIG
jgi:pSer/pThr/pTyr-binding forkhead associated (FHA) protein